MGVRCGDCVRGVIYLLSIHRFYPPLGAVDIFKICQNAGGWEFSERG